MLRLKKTGAEIKELKAVEVELTTESTAISAEVADSHRKLLEVERSLRGDDRGGGGGSAKGGSTEGAASLRAERDQGC